MPAATLNPESALPDVSQMTKVQKLAVLLVLLGPESSAQILRSLGVAEMEAITSEMAKPMMISQDAQIEILKEFSTLAVDASTSLRGGLEYAQGVLEKAVGLFRATDIITRVSPNRIPVAAFQPIAEMEARLLYNLLKLEQPQTVALVASFLTPDKASQLLLQFGEEAREQVVGRLATLAPTPIEVVDKVVEMLNLKLGGKHTRALSQSGGIKAAAALLNAMDKTLSKTLLTSLEEHQPELGRAIRQKMFTFEDLMNLEPPTLQRILREVDMRDLAVALKTAPDKLKSTLLACISRRAAETVSEEIAYMAPTKARDIEAAQLNIIEAVRRLESEGEIDLGDNREDCFSPVNPWTIRREG